MTEEENEKKGFRVVDRRRFTSEGELKPEAANMPDPRPTPMPSAPPRPAAAAPAEPPPRQDPRQAPRGAPPPQSAPSPRAQRGGMDFISFVASLATNALAAMGAIPEARAQGMPVNFEMAREYIEIIAMLQEKTRGNLDAEEEASLQRVVSELKMTFVELQKRGAPAR